MAQFFINRPIVAMVIAILTVIVGGITIFTPARGAVSQHRAAGNQNSGHLCRCRWRYPGPIGGYAHRRADERRGQHELHVVGKCNWQRADAHDRGFCRWHRPQYGPDSHPNARDPGRRIFALAGCAIRCDGTEIDFGAADACGLVFPARDLRRPIPGELCLYQPERPRHARTGRSPSADLRSGPICDAGLAGPECAGTS